ncbi:MAG TPA: phosphotransferase [Kofleriaceae bacterium]|nr:phosphotransferase [Kofleriaceae bacterium]
MVRAPATPPPAVRAAWAWGDDVELTAIPIGLINTTFAVRRGGAPIAVVQRLHPVFGPEVNLDIEAVTAHLAARGLVTPRLIRTEAGDAWLTVDGEVWRALTWVDGVSFDAVPGPAWARAGGELVGRFHRAVDDLVHDYAFTRAGVHDTAAHLGRLRDRVAAAGDDAAEAVDLATAILAAADGLPPLPDVPRRHAHGDLKISNLLFRARSSAPEPVALVDLDTVGHQTLAFELGDAMRSWCNPRGEDETAAGFDLAIFAAAIEGWSAAAGALVSTEERWSIVVGLETVCVELAARFAVDIFDDRYFGWDPSRFPSRRAHNLVRARGQLALGLSVRAARADALDVVMTGT